MLISGCCQQYNIMSKSTNCSVVVCGPNCNPRTTLFHLFQAPQEGNVISLDVDAGLRSTNPILLIPSLCGVMHLITTSEVISADESIHTSADRRMVISLMNGAFDQDLNGSCECLSTPLPSRLHNILIIRSERTQHPRESVETKCVTKCNAKSNGETRRCR